MSLYPHARFMLSVDRLPQLPEDTGTEVAFTGRSNAGKSSAINALTERRNLARSSKTPGRTQLINLFELARGQRLADLPGYGYARVPPALQRHWQALVAEYLKTRTSLQGLFLAVDARRGLSEQDRFLIEWAQSFSLPVQVLLTKADKLTRNEAHKCLRQAQQAVTALPGAQVQLFSAESKQGLQEAQQVLQGMLEKSPDGAEAPPGQTNPAWG